MMRALLIVAFVAGACSSGGDATYDYAHSKGAAIYQDTCQVCHGETGEGGLGPALRDTGKSVDDLVNVIQMRMPANSPGQCSGDFATGTAQFIYDCLTSKALAYKSPWTPDPRAPASAPAGFGGPNSRLDLACSGGNALAQDPTSEFPVETRRSGFPFDTDADAALVTSAHVDAYLAAAEKLADFAAADPNQLAACDWAAAPGSCGRAVATDLGRRRFRTPLTPQELAR